MGADMEPHLWIKLAHVLGATVLFGTGLGTAFHMWRAHLTGDARAIAAAARSTVIADTWFTAPAVIVQPVTGGLLIWFMGHNPWAPWLLWVYALYALAGACWLPVVVLQTRAGDLAVAAVAADVQLPPEYFRVMRWWFALGWPAFSASTAIK